MLFCCKWWILHYIKPEISELTDIGVNTALLNQAPRELIGCQSSYEKAGQTSPEKGQAKIW